MLLFQTHTCGCLGSCRIVPVPGGEYRIACPFRPRACAFIYGALTAPPCPNGVQIWGRAPPAVFKGVHHGGNRRFHGGGASHHHHYGRGPHPCDLTRCEFVLSYRPAAPLGLVRVWECPAPWPARPGGSWCTCWVGAIEVQECMPGCSHQAYQDTSLKTVRQRLFFVSVGALQWLSRHAPYHALGASRPRRPWRWSLSRAPWLGAVLAGGRPLAAPCRCAEARAGLPRSAGAGVARGCPTRPAVHDNRGKNGFDGDTYAHTMRDCLGTFLRNTLFFRMIRYLMPFRSERRLLLTVKNLLFAPGGPFSPGDSVSLSSHWWQGCRGGVCASEGILWPRNTAYL